MSHFTNFILIFKYSYGWNGRKDNLKKKYSYITAT